MGNEEKANRFAKLASRSKEICPGCQKGSPPVENLGSWFHVVNHDGTYSLMPSAGMMQPCAASAMLTEMQLLRTQLA
jgi:hypothetical protein